MSSLRFSSESELVSIDCFCHHFLSLKINPNLFQSRKIYRFLNKMSLNELPFEIKYKLMETIERVGGEPIGFTCSDLFIVTWTTFAEVSVHNSIHSVLKIRFKNIRSLFLTKKIPERDQYCDILHDGGWDC